MSVAIRSGDAVFAFGGDLRVVAWNEAMETLTGVPAPEALERPCWEVLGAVDGDGSLVCHPGCSGARLAREGWPLPCRRVLVRSAEGRTPVTMSTIVVRDAAGEPLILHLLRNGVPVEDELPVVEARLTPRQREVLTLLAEGLPAKLVAARLGVTQPTVRNHIRGILTELGCHSQLQALAEARRRRLL